MESTTSIPEPKKRFNWQAPFKRLMDNPVILKELRGRMRGRQAFILLTIYLGLISLFIILIYNLLNLSSSITWDPSARQNAGKAIFGTVVLLELLLLSFIAPGLTAGAITSERERQTFEILRTTLLSARSLVLGKVGSAFSFLFLLILAALPLESLAFLLGGVGLGEMIASSLMLVVTAIFYCTLGIFFSSFMKRTLPATVSSYAVILLSFLLLAVIFFMIAYLESISSGQFGAQTAEDFLSLILWLLISTNPLMAAIISEVILMDQQNLFYTTHSIFGGSSSIPFLISPWLIYTVVYLFMTVVMIWLSIRFVNRPDK